MILDYQTLVIVPSGADLDSETKSKLVSLLNSDEFEKVRARELKRAQPLLKAVERSHPTYIGRRENYFVKTIKNFYRKYLRGRH